jgi:hypothetical protein
MLLALIYKIMLMSKKMLKKAPLPYRVLQHNHPHYEFSYKIIQIIKYSFNNIFGERVNLSTKERKIWGEFLFKREIYWDIYVSKKYEWTDWEYSSNKMIPKNLKHHLKVGYYYITKDLSMKMLVLGELL